MSDKGQVAWSLVKIIPLLMRNIGADMRCFGGGLAASHFGLLGMLSHKDYSLTELAEYQAVTLATMSNTITTLVDKGYVKRITPLHDRRVVQVTLTQAGREVLSAVHQQLEQHLEEMLASLPEAELCQLDDGVRVLRKVLESADWKNIPRCSDINLSVERLSGKLGEIRENE